MLNFIGPIEWNNSGTNKPYCSTCDFGVCPPAFPALDHLSNPSFTGDGGSTGDGGRGTRGGSHTRKALFARVGILGTNPGPGVVYIICPGCGGLFQESPEVPGCFTRHAGFLTVHCTK